MSAVPIHLLLLEDNPGDARLVQVALAGQAPGEFVITTVERLAGALARIQTERFNVALCDLGLPDSTGLGSARAIAVAAPDMALVVLTGSHNEDMGRAAINLGAQDYLVKGEASAPMIARTLRYAIERKRLENELREANLTLERRVAERTAGLAAANERLRANQVQLQGVLGATADGILAVDPTGRMILANQRFAELWRIPQALLDNKNDQLLLDCVESQLSDPQAFRNKVQELYRSDAQDFDTLTFKDDRVFERFSSPLMSDGSNAGRVWSFRDVTDRKRHERLLAESEKRFRVLIEQSLTGIYLTQDGEFLYANPRLEQLLGYGSGEMVGVRADDFVVAQDLPILQAEREKLRAGADSSSYSVRVRRRDGSVIELGVQGRVCEMANGLVTIGMAQDISEKKRAEEQIQRHIEQLKTAFMSTVEVATLISEMRDPYTAGHERRVAEIAVAIGGELGLDPQRIEGLRVAGFLHDIGKITIPAEILSKPGKLSLIEFQLVQTHAQAGYDVLKGVEFPWPVAQIALQHHERIDGSGYPQGLKGDAIMLEARILAVADVVEAMSSHRPYRAGLGIEAALSEIERGRGIIYDEQVVDACLRLFRDRGYVIPG